MKRRQRKKLHRKLLPEVAMDLSVEPAWRQQLMDSEEGQGLAVDATTVAGLGFSWLPKLKRYELEFRAARVAAEGVDPWISQNGELIVFAFWSPAFPTLRCHTGNMP